LSYKEQILDIIYQKLLQNEKLLDDEESLLDKNELEELDNDQLQTHIMFDDEFLIDQDEIEIFL